MDNRSKYKELKRSGSLISVAKNNNIKEELYSMDNHAFRVTLYCGTPFTISREPLDRYIPKFGEF